MKPKPKHLDVKYGEQFKDASVVAAYHHRPTYPSAVFDILDDLMADGPRSLLDIGCGPGSIARYLIDYVDRIDAVDFSAEMIARAQTLPNGDHPHIRWIHAPVEEAPLNPPYALITAGASLHWMAWEVVFPRFRDNLSPDGYLALVSNPSAPVPWWDSLQTIIDRYSTNRDYQRYSLVDELRKRSLFRVCGEAETEAISFVQSVDDYIESFHARNGFSRDRMSAKAAAAFDQESRKLVSSHCPDGLVRLKIKGRVRWGIPQVPPVM